jgi:hydroxymethylpyrimidine kinase / phosphomethylpyrimidine kinase / thiamine-phosphate diphosphorylase
LSEAIVWTIAGSDSGGGAGIQADLKTFNGLGVYGASVITAITAQNTLGVTKIESVSGEAIKAQIEALHADLPAKVVKTGMLYSTACLQVVGDFFRSNDVYVVCDPVMVATSGDALIEPAFIETLKTKVLPYVNLLTPNLEEAHKLLGWPQDKLSGDVDQYVSTLASELLRLGPKSVLVKGAGGDDRFNQDYWSDGQKRIWLTALTQKTRHTHGTGCTLASAIAASIALGYAEEDALVISKAYVNQGLRSAPGLGGGQGPMAHLAWPENPEDLPWISKTSHEGRNRPQFKDCGQEPLGFYPIVDSIEWIERLLPLGVKTIQLRIKNLTTERLEDEISKATRLCEQQNCRLFINDYWQLAIKHGAYGVHLGYEDLQNADINAISQAGIRLGLSTHRYSEVATALYLRPSYIAIGPIFSTTTKVVNTLPQGVAALKRWRRSLKYPLVAIGGIALENAKEIKEAGANGIAVVSDIVKATNLNRRVESWLELFPN